MKTLNIFRILLIIALISVTLGVPSLARAGGDTHYQIVIPVDNYWTWYASDFDNPCGFDIEFHDYGNFRANYWLDENEKLTHEIDIYGNLKQVASAHGKSLNIQLHGPAQYTFFDNKVIAKITGPEMLTIPGYGWFDGWVGLQILTWEIDPITGEWINFKAEKLAGHFSGDVDYSPLCSYFGPE